MTTAMDTPPSAKVSARVRHPRTRGAFQPVDAARRQLGLLSVADGRGQCRIYWLVDLATTVIEDSRFLAFGSLASHALADVFTESVRGRTVADAARLTVEQIESLLRDDPATTACDPAEAAFITELQELAVQELPTVALLPKPAEVVSYQRKRELDWSEVDRAWLPLTLLKKVAKVDQVLRTAVAERVGAGATFSIEGLHDDFRVVVAFGGVAEEQLPTVAQLLQDVLRGAIHPQLTVDAVRKKG
jgi:NifU-like protein involved in Fe-S cluster formation